MPGHYAPILAQGLLSSGFVRTFPHTLAHNPLKFCGANVPNLFTEQILAHTHTLLKYSNLPHDLMGFLLWSSGEVMQLETGLKGQLFEALLVLEEVIMDSWMKHTWLATCQYDIHMMEDIPDFPLNWQGDKELVCIFLQHGVWQPQLGTLHWCQMFLHALCLSNLCTGMSDQLLTTQWWNYKPLYSEYHWPRTAPPSPTDWNTWDATLTTVFNTGRYQTLPQKLGSYFSTTYSRWYYNLEVLALWFNSGVAWTRHCNIPLQSCTMSFHKQGESSEPPPLTHHATVQEHETKIILTGTGPILPKSKPSKCMAQLQQHQFYHEWQWEITITGNLPNVVESLLEGDGYAVSNGSFQMGRGAAAWIIEGRDNTNQLIRTCLSPSNEEGHSSF